MLTTIRSWTGLLSRLGFRVSQQRQSRCRRRQRAWRDATCHHAAFEPCEPRHMLTAFSISDVTQTEGGAFQFTISIDALPAIMASVQYATANGTAVSGSDYSPVSGTAMFTPMGNLTQTVTVNSINDSADEDSEFFYINLSNPVNGTIADGQGIGTITDNDDPPTISINNANFPEGGNITFTASLSAASGKTVTVDFATADNGSAIAGVDYTAAGGTLTFAPGETSKQFTVSTISDLLDENDEQFLVNLSNAGNATIADGQGIGTITDDDPLPTVSIIAGDSVVEGGNLTFDVTLSEASGREVSVDFRVTDNSTTVDVDYLGTSGTLVFAPGETTKVITIQTLDDNADEDPETLNVIIDGQVNATLGATSQIGTITDNDDPPEISIGDAWAVEGDNAVFEVWLSAASGKTVTVNYATADGDAVVTSDYSSTSGNLTFNPGEVVKTVSVPTVADAVQEANKEYFYVDLSTPGNATIDDGRGKGWILDDDGPRTVNVAHAWAMEGWTTSVNIYLNAPSANTITVDWALDDGSAKVSDNDYTDDGGTVTFAPGEIFKTISVVTILNPEKEGTEQLSVNLSNPTNATIGKDPGRVVIYEEFPEKKVVKACDCNCGCANATTSENPASGDQTTTDTNSLSQHNGPNSNPHPVISFDTTFSEVALTETKYIKVQLTFGGLVQPAVYYSTAGIEEDDLVRFALRADADALDTGRYEWEAEITEHYIDGTEIARTITGYHSIVNLSDSPFGRRTWLDYLDRLVVQDDGVLWVRGNTDTFWFAEDGVGGFTGAEGDLADAVLVQNIDDSFTLTPKDGSVWEFDETGLLTERIDATGNTWTFDYADENGDSVANELVLVTDPAGRETALAYVDGLLSTITNDQGVTTYEHDEDRHLVSITRPDPDGEGEQEAPETTFTHDPVTHLVTSMTRASGSTTTWEYDAFRMLSKRTTGSSEVEFTPLFGLGLVDTAAGEGTIRNLAPMLLAEEAVGSRTNELNETEYFTTDRFGYFLTYTDALGNTTLYERDADGRVTRITLPDPDGEGPQEAPVTDFDYDSRGNLVLITWADESTQAWTYDATFNVVTSFTDELGRVTMYEVDSGTGQITEIRRVVGEIDDGINLETDDVVTLIEYTPPPTGGSDPPAGLIAKITDALGRETLFDYNARGLVTAITYAAGTADEATVNMEYNAAGYLTAVEDELGRRTEYTVDALGQVTAVTGPDPDGAGELESPVWSYVWNTMGKVTRATDPLGRQTDYTYGAFGNLVRIDQPDHDDDEDLTTTAFGYNLAGWQTSVTDALDCVVSYQYDAAGRVTGVTLPDPDGVGELESPELEFTYDNLGRMVAETDALGYVTLYEYDSRGRLLSVTLPDPDGGGALTAPVTEYTWDAAGQLLSVTDPLGRVTSYEYNELGQLVKIIAPDPDGAGAQSAPETEFAYDKVGNLRFVTDALGNVTEYQFDYRNRLVKIIAPDPDGVGGQSAPETAYAWDDAGQLTSVTDALGRVTSYTYDALGRVILVTLPDPDGGGAQTAPQYAYTYDAVGNVLTVTDPLGNVTTYDYDLLNNLVSVTQPDPDGAGGLASPVTAFTHDAVGNMLTLTDPLGNTTEWVYDGLNRVIEETNELDATRYFVYDAASNLVEKTDRNGRVTQYVYDNLHRRVQEKWLDGMSVVRTMDYEWDAAGQLLSAADEDSSYACAYDPLGRVIEIMADNGGPIVVLTQAFDAAGNRTSLAAEIDSVDDFLTNYTFDGLGRMTRITQEGQSGGNTVAEKRVDLSYFADGQFDTISRYKDTSGGSGNLVAESIYDYDLLGRLTDLTHGDGTSTIDAFAWTYDAASRMTQFYSVEDGTSDYSYDNTSQLTAADHDYQADEAYEFDLNGNRVMAGYVIHDNNQLLSDGTWDYEYDDEGNTILKTRISNDPAEDYTVEYEWDHRNRLIGVTHRDNYGVITMSAIYVYDVLDRRIAKIVDLDGTGGDAAETVQFIHDGDHIALAFDGNDDLIRRFLHGPAIDQILAEEDVAQAELLWMLADNLGSVRTVLDNSSAVVNHITYSAFGALTGETNPIDQFFYFTGRELDKETGDQYNRRRFYASDIGQWRSPDPIGFAAGDPNDRRYVGNSPTLFVDPSGLAQTRWWNGIKILVDLETAELILENGKRIKIRNAKFIDSNVSLHDLERLTKVSKDRIQRLREKFGDNLSIMYDCDGQPDFSLHMRARVKIADPGVGDYADQAWKQLASDDPALHQQLIPYRDQYNWHHAADGSLQLIDADLHTAFQHTGLNSVMGHLGAAAIAIIPGALELSEGRISDAGRTGFFETFFGWSSLIADGLGAFYEECLYEVYGRNPYEDD